MGGISGAQGRQGASLPPRLRRTPCPAAGRSPARRRPRRRLWPSPAPAGASPRLPAATGRAARRGRAPAGGSRAPRLGGGGCAAPAPPGPPAPSPAAPVRPARPDPASPRAEPGQAGLAPHTPAPRPGSYRNPPGVGAGGGGGQRPSPADGSVGQAAVGSSRPHGTVCPGDGRSPSHPPRDASAAACFAGGANALAGPQPRDRAQLPGDTKPRLWGSPRRPRGPTPQSCHRSWHHPRHGTNAGVSGQEHCRGLPALCTLGTSAVGHPTPR